MNWKNFILEERKQEYFKNIEQFINQDKKQYNIFPPREDLFNAFKLAPYDTIKVMILGQDPYHSAGQAHGLAFSVKDGVPIPPSLKNIYKELYDDLGIEQSNTGNLTPWTKQGIFLLNSMLTVREGQPESHAKIGWQTFTDRVISKINEKEAPVCFLLMGNFAKEKKRLITNPQNFIIETNHPSPLSSYRFFGSKPFSKINSFLKENNIEEINWKL